MSGEWEPSPVQLWREGKLRRAKPVEFHFADIARLQVTQTGKRAAGHKLTRTHSDGIPHHLDKRNYNAKRVTRWMAACLINHSFTVDDERHLRFRGPQLLLFNVSSAINKTAVAHAIS